MTYLRYHLEKQTRVYDGTPYSGHSSDGASCESDSFDEIVAMQAELQRKNPVGWNIWDSHTRTLLDGTDFFKE